MDNKISIVIPTLNDKSNLRNLLEDIMHQILLPYEIICVDGGSNDGTIELAQSYGKCIIVEKKDKNNAIQCTNIGALNSLGDIILFTASDVRLNRNTLSIINNEFELDKYLIAMTGRPIPYDCNILGKLEYGLYYTMALALSKVRFVSSGSFLIVKRSAYNKSRGFEFTYNTDGELGMRLIKLGKTKFKNDLTYHVSARRLNRYGLIRFNKEYLYTIENFINVDMSRLGAIHIESPSH